MRYVMVWFACSVKGCEAKAETLVAYRTYHAGPSGQILDDTTLPEGWSWRIDEDERGRYRYEVTDRERTICPDHKWHGSKLGA